MMQIMKPLDVMFTDFKIDNGLQKVTGEIKNRYSKLYHCGLSENADRCTTGILYDEKNKVLFHFPPVIVCQQSINKFFRNMQEIFKDGFNTFIIGAKASDIKSMKSADEILNALEKENLKFNAIIGKQDVNALDNILVKSNSIDVQQTNLDLQKSQKILSINDLEDKYAYVERNEDIANFIFNA